jgi:hypothetical protein
MKVKEGPMPRHQSRAEVRETVMATIILWSISRGTGHLEDRETRGNDRLQGVNSAEA